MFSKEESKRLRQDFWIAFGKSYPRKWIRYNTNIKGFSLKFHFTVRYTMVSMDIESADLAHRIDLWEKIVSLKAILLEDYLPEAQFEDVFFLENQKEISRVYVKKEGVSIHTKNTWQETMIFLNDHMDKMEAFFLEFKPLLEG